MAITTKIEWTDSTINAMMGCDGCELWSKKVRNCYAGNMTARYAGQAGWPKSFDQPTMFPDRIMKAASWSDLTGKDRPEKPWLNGLPRHIFLDDMGDTFTESLPVDWIRPHIKAMEKSPHVWMFLTKRPRRMLAFFESLGYVPRNFMLGTTVTTQRTADIRLKYLSAIGDIDKSVRLWISAEPLLEEVDLGKWLRNQYGQLIDLVIIGGESGPSARPMNPHWAKSMIWECQSSAVDVFVKQLGGKSEKGGDMSKWPEHLRIREFPRNAPIQQKPATQATLFEIPNRRQYA